jgi:hypothetical protein
MARAGNVRLQEMMAKMVEERGGKVYGMDHRWVSRLPEASFGSNLRKFSL